jgi:hypothetical protein
MSTFRLQLKSGLGWESRWFEVSGSIVRFKSEDASKVGSFEGLDVASIKDSSASFTPLLKGCGFELEFSSSKKIVLCAASLAQKKEFIDLLLKAKSSGGSGGAPAPRSSRSSQVAPVLTRGKSDGAIDKPAPPPLLRRSSGNVREPEEVAFIAFCDDMEKRIESAKEASVVLQLKGDVLGKGQAMLDACKASGMAKARMEILLSKIMQAERGSSAAAAPAPAAPVRRKSDILLAQIDSSTLQRRSAIEAAGKQFFEWIQRKNQELDVLAEAPESFSVDDMKERAIKMERIKSAVVTEGKPLFQKTSKGIESVSQISKLVDRIRKGEKAISYALNLAAKKEEVLLPIVSLSNDDDADTIIISKIEESPPVRTQLEKEQFYQRRGTIVCLTESTVEVENLASDFERELNLLLENQ